MEIKVQYLFSARNSVSLAVVFEQDRALLVTNARRRPLKEFWGAVSKTVPPKQAVLTRKIINQTVVNQNNGFARP